MHAYLPSIGYRGIDNDDLKLILTDIEAHPDSQNATGPYADEHVVVLRKEYAPHIGVTVKGNIDPEDGFVLDYYYPYFEGTAVSTTEDVEIIRISDRDSFQGVVDDPRIGIDLVFYITDAYPQVLSDYEQGKLVNHGGVRLTGLATRGMILLPLSEEIRPEENAEKSARHVELVRNAREGDTEAIEKLSAEDVDRYNEAGERMKDEDVLTIVSSYIMPEGIECDKYSILGDIISDSVVLNRATHQTVHMFTVRCNDLTLEICINGEDLIGAPAAGRRFKGDIWLQGRIS